MYYKMSCVEYRIDKMGCFRYKDVFFVQIKFRIIVVKFCWRGHTQQRVALPDLWGLHCEPL